MSAPHARTRSDGVSSERTPGQSSGWWPSTLSTTILSGHGFTSSRTPMSSTCTTAEPKSQRYGARRRRIFAIRRSVLPMRSSSGGGCVHRRAHDAEGPEPDLGGHDVERVVEDATEADVLRHDDSEVDDAEREADAGDLGNAEERAEEDR